MPNLPTLRLVMMVKNEAPVIRRALESALPYIDSWTICDTGSNDGTQEIIREALKDLPGTLHEVPWVNFGHNRTQAVKLAKDKADYLLILDADMELSVDYLMRSPVMDYAEVEPWNAACLKRELREDAYELRYQGDLDYALPFILSTKPEWRYEGVTHEYLMSPTVSVFSPLPGVSIIDHEDGTNRADKFRRDIGLLLEDLKTNPGNPRSVFYLAQSYKDLGQWGEALYWYEKREQMGGFDEERWYAALMFARMLQRIGTKEEQVREAYLRAYALRPSRLEPIFWLAQFCRLNGQHEMAFLFSSIAGTQILYPGNDRLFIDRRVYTYLMSYELGMAAANTGRIPLASMVAERLSRTQGVEGDYIHNLEETIRLLSGS